MVFLFLGLPCTGKTTCATKLAQTFGHYVNLDFGKAGRDFPLKKLHASTQSIVINALELSKTLSKPIFIDSHCGFFSIDTLVEFCLKGGYIVWSIPHAEDKRMLISLSKKRGDSEEFTDSYEEDFEHWVSGQAHNFSDVESLVRDSKDLYYAQEHVKLVTNFIDLLKAFDAVWGSVNKCESRLPENGQWNTDLLHESVELENGALELDAILTKLRSSDRDHPLSSAETSALLWSVTTMRYRYAMQQEVE